MHIIDDVIFLMVLNSEISLNVYLEKVIELGTEKQCLKSYFWHHVVKKKTFFYVLINQAFFKLRLKLHLYLVADNSFAEIFNALLEGTATFKMNRPCL